jgi:transcription initiation factor TFIIB
MLDIKGSNHNITKKWVRKNNKTQKIKRTYTWEEKQQLLASFGETSPPTTEYLIHNNENQDYCYLCNSILLLMEDGMPTCTNSNCGIIYKDMLDFSPEWRFYGADDKNSVDPTRCGNPINPLLKESSFGCQILCGQRASYQMKKIQKWTEWQSMPHREKALYDEFQFISNMAQHAGIPKIFIDDAMVFHKSISEQKMLRGLNRDGIKSASIYIACRIRGSPRTAHEIAKIFCIDKISATNGCSMAITIMNNMERGGFDTGNLKLCTTTPSLFIDRYCSQLHINEEFTHLANFVAKKIEKENLVKDNTPNAVASGIIYFISDCFRLGITKGQMKEITDISEVTINKCYQKLKQHVANGHPLIPQVLLTKYGVHSVGSNTNLI